MMRAITVTITLGAALSLAACANDSLLGNGATTTAALPAKPVKPAADPACRTLAAQIAELRKDGIVERVEAASKGKTKTVSVKRDSLAKVAELEKANATFQAKCSTLPTTAVAPAAPAPVAPAVAAAAVGAAAKPAVKTAATAVAAKAAPAATAAAIATKAAATPAKP